MAISIFNQDLREIEPSIVARKLLFISYANANSDKVRLIKKELENHPVFEPLIVADRRSANDALTQLVTDGIDKSYCIVPILSPQSFKEQWINQEIEYAKGKGIPIVPIVESTLLDHDDLKGFVHKQNQCPYTYTARLRLHLRDENKEFKKSFKLLLKDLEKLVSEDVPKSKRPVQVWRL